ncbi:hypothetical protein BDQ12DRAFT_79136, partial [Crucibulum laeve]
MGDIIDLLNINRNSGLSIPAIVAPLLTSNDAPSCEQSISIKSMKSSDELDLVTIESEIRKLEDRLVNMKAQYAEKQKHISLCSALSSPIRLFPPEILSAIFIYCIDLREKPYRGPRRKDVPLLLCQVSSSWRRVALNTPELWCRVSFDLIPVSQKLLYWWMPRARNLPLSFQFKYYNKPDRAALYDSLVLPYASRIRHLDLDSWDKVIFSLQEMKSLHSLVLRMSVRQG